MDTTRIGSSERLIQLADFMAPVRIVQALGGEDCRRYSVLVEGPDGSRSRMILLEYGCDAASLAEFEASASVLNRMQNLAVPMPRYWTYGSHPERRYILVDADHQDCFGLADLARKPLGERLDILAQLLEHAAELEDRGVLLRSMDWNCVYHRDSRARFWNYAHAQLHRDMDEAAWQEAHRCAMAGLARLVYFGILGQELKEEDLRPNLTVLLCHVSDWEGVTGICDTLERCLTREEEIRVDKLRDELDYIREFPPEEQTGDCWENWQCVADFLHGNPLYPYVRKNDRGEALLNVVLFGRSELRSAFFSQILSTAQMLDTRLHIHVIAPDASQFRAEWETRAPLLKRVARVNGDDSALDPILTGRDAGKQVLPLAELTFEDARMISAEALLQEGTGCLLLLEPYGDSVSFEICDLVNRTEQPLLVAIRQERPVVYAQMGKHKAATLRSFHRGGNGAFADTGIYAKALGVQTYYDKYYDQRISDEEIRRNFLDKRSDFYNLRSSVRSALSIPYKFASCGLGQQENERFYQLVREDPDRKLRNRLIWLEHRSWQAHLILDGWQLNPEDYGGGFEDLPFSQKSNAEKWHACIRGSDDTGTLPLEEWDWENGDLTDLDPLDRMSVEIHRGLTAKAERHQAELDACLDSVKRQLTPAQYQQVRNSVKQLRERVTNAAVGWSRTCTELGWADGDSGTERTVQMLKKRVRELVDRNAYRDYKLIDLSIIQAIPYLNLRRSFRHVYSLCAGQPWHNVAAAMLLEPEQLCLLTDERHDMTDAELGHCESFLRERRRLDVEIVRSTMEELEDLPQDAVLDVTGADADQLLAIRNHPELKKLPLVAYREGRLVSPDGSCSEVRFDPLDRSITVEEMMSLTGTTVLSEFSDIPMHGMYRYRELWETVQLAELEDRNQYNQTCSFLSSLDQPLGISAKSCLVDVGVPRKAARAYGFDDLISRMQSAGLLKKQGNSDTAKVLKPQQFRDIEKAIEKVKKCICVQTADTGDRFALEQAPNGKFRDWKIRFGGNEVAVIRNYRLFPWSAGYSRSDARDNGLLPLLEKLQDHKVIKPFVLPGDIVAVDPYCQDSLNKLLDEYCNAVGNGTHGDLHLNFAPENPDNICELEDRCLEVSRSFGLTGGSIRYEVSKEYRYLAPDMLRHCLELFEEKKLICPVDGDPLLAWKDQKAVLHFRYADQAAKACLTKTGNALEALTYHTLRSMNYFDDVKLGVSIQWDRDRVEGRDTRNEIDVICTRGLKSWFISCKQTYKLEMAYLNEIRYETDRFGLDATPILVTTASYLNNPSCYDRAKRMGIHVISLKKLPLRKDLLNPGAEALAGQLRRILEEA